MAELSYTERKSTRFNENLTDRLWRHLTNLARDIVGWHGAHVADRNLRRLDDRLLADIGLKRDQASGMLEELPERLSAAPVHPARVVPDRASALASYRNLWR